MVLQTIGTTGTFIDIAFNHPVLAAACTCAVSGSLGALQPLGTRHTAAPFPPSPIGDLHEDDDALDTAPVC